MWRGWILRLVCIAAGVGLFLNIDGEQDGLV
jgi:hypothetical protein